jgi:hypothetical protein
MQNRFFQVAARVSPSEYIYGSNNIYAGTLLSMNHQKSFITNFVCENRVGGKRLELVTSELHNA